MSPVPLNLVTASLSEIVDALHDGRTSSVNLVEAYLARIEADNYQGQKFHAVIETAPRASVIQRAQELDRERNEGKVRGPLHGVPVLVKDNIYTDPYLGMQTTAGSNALVGSKVPRNATVIDNLMNSGAIVIGKTNMTVFANFYGSDTKLTWSPRGGITLNPYVANVSSFGSSSGSAVALGVGFCAGAIGTETTGSISSPAEQTGLYALKPSFGLIPTEGVIRTSLRQDVIGPFGKSVWDLAAMLSGMVSSSHSTGFLPSSITERAYLSNFSLGVLRWPSDGRYLPEERNNLFDNIIKELKFAYPESFVDDPADLIPLEEHKRSEGFVNGKWQGDEGMMLLVTDLHEAMNHHLSCIEDCAVKNIDDLVKWNSNNPDKAFFNGGPETDDSQRWLRCARDSKGHTRPGSAYDLGLQSFLAKGRTVLEYMDTKGLDALLMPSFAQRAAKLSASIGFPMATIPYGVLSDGEPCGLWVIAKPGEDKKLLSIMAACEKIFPPRPIPGCFSENAELSD